LRATLKIVVFLSICTSLFSEQPELKSATILNKETAFYGDGTPGPYNLADRFILVGSDFIYISDTLISKDQYQIDYEQGIIVFSNPLPESIMVIARYQRIPFLDLASRYFQHIAETETSFETAKPEKIMFDTASTSDFEALSVNGSKTLGFSISSGQGLGIEQATRLNLMGTVSGVEIEAELSDQSSPIPPEGVTKEISELDKMLIKIRKGGLAASFGDYDLTMPFGSFGTIERRSTGALVTGNFGKSNVQASYARPKGKFQRLIFSGIDGVQGPYRLSSDVTNFTSLRLVPASEMVYLNGEKMVRGWNEDYTIDYSAAEITFTNKRIITARSRIEVNFEYTFDVYDRNAFGIGADYSLSPFFFGVKTFNESDNQNRSLAYNLSSTDIESLSVIGDDTSRAWLEGGRYVGANQGGYYKESDHYVYAGPDSGDYDVFFTFVGDSLGNYIYDDSIYIYTGWHSGQYVAKRHILLPEKDEIYLASLGLKTENGFNLGWEGSMSRTDLNLFSQIDDSTNNGFAYATNASYEKPNYGITYQRKVTPSNFSNPMRSQEVDFSYNWGDIREEERLSSDELNSFLKPFNFFSVNAGAGRLLTLNHETRNRFSAGTKLFWSGYEISKVEKILRQSLNLKPHISFLYPRLYLFKEDQAESRSLTLNPALGLEPTKNWKTTLSFDQTQEQRQDTLVALWRKGSVRRTYKIDFNAKPFSQLEFKGIFGLQDKHYQEITGTDWHQYFADLSGNYSLAKGITFQINHHQSNQQTQSQQERYIRVDSGTGDYKFNPETGTFYPDSNGDYRRVLEPTGRISRSQEQEWQGNIDFSVFDPVNLNALLNFNQEVTDTTVIYRVYNHDARLGLFPFSQNRDISVYFDNNYSYSLDYRYASEKYRQNRNGIEVRGALSDDLQLKSRLELNLSQRERNQPLFEGLCPSNSLFFGFSRRGERGATLRLKVNREIERKVIFKPYIGYQFDLDLSLNQSWRDITYFNYNQFQLRTTNLGIKRRWQIQKNTALTVEVSIIRRTADIERLPFEIGLSDPLGLTKGFNLAVDQIISKELVFSASYNFEDRPDRAAEQSLSANLRAYF
jgi:hypothetical protein